MNKDLNFIKSLTTVEITDKITILKQLVDNAVTEYNKFRGVEAQAKVVEVREDGTLLIEFTGNFCHTCGVFDWVEDLAYIIKSMGYEAELIKYIEPEQPENMNKRYGIFKIRIT
ncbi:MAG: hypothetical protein RMH77_00050 [Sulfolobales archaeon]|nr:hypothetical protein [Sulfolobales archaeon]MCX8186767.1 hypothetical protein [Sulfolobales archaeon]MDW7968794.1 hypothetical protein [Sulfolobales archaeon]